MITTNANEYIWVEKYRPKTIDECILSDTLKKSLQEMITRGDIQNLMLVGGAGTGKTTIARALCEELDLDYTILNCSEEGNIDTIRTFIRSYASAISFNGNAKCIIMDEADGLTAVAQQALRNFIEEFSTSCRFIFTANFGNKIIEPLKSRTSQIDMSLSKEDKIKVIVAFDKRIREILELENVEYDHKVLSQLIIKYFPDMRRTLNELQRLTLGGALDADAMSMVSVDAVRDVYAMLKGKKFTELRRWVVQNPNMDLAILSRMLWNHVDDYVKSESIPQMLLHMNQYQLNSAIVADKEINMMAFLTELMVDVEFR